MISETEGVIKEFTISPTLPPSLDLQLLRQALDASAVGVAVTDATLPDNPLVYVNPAFERLSGYRFSEIIGRNCRFLQGQDRDQAARYALRQAVEQRRSVTVVLRNYRADGALFYNELTISPVHDVSGQLTHFVGFQNDVTAREEGAALMRRLMQLTQALAAVGHQAGVFEIILQDALEALSGVAGAVLLVEGARLRVAARRGPAQEAGVWQAAALDESGPAADALRLGQPLFFRASGELVSAYPDLEARTGGLAAVASAVLPMVEAGRPLGVIVLDFSEPYDFSASEQAFLQTLAAQCAVTLERARLSDDLERQVEQRSAELGAFVRFSEAASSEDDVLVLAQRAVDVLGVLFTQATSGYYALDEGQWKLRVYSPDLVAQRDVLTGLQAGVPLDIPVFEEALRSGQAVFVDAWNPMTAGTSQAQAYQSVATYPLTLDGQPLAVFGIGLKDTARWSAQGRATFQAVGRSLNLAIERTEAARRLGAQNAELTARTRALEGFAELTRDLSAAGEATTLIQSALAMALSLLPPGYAAFWERQGERWQASVQVGDVGDADLQAVISAGLPTDATPTLDTPARTRQPYYQDVYLQGLDTPAEIVSHVNAVATLPVLVGDEVVGLFNVPLFDTRFWSAADKAVLESTVRSLGLALERAGQTRQLTAQRDLLETRTQALQASNEELEAFTYSVSHDLRTPVRHIISFGSLLRRALPQPLDAKAERYFGVVEEAAARLSQLIDGMLEVSRTSRQVLATESVDLNRLFEVERAELERQNGLMTGQVEWQVAELPQVTGDSGLLRRVVRAFLDNALKFSRARVPARIEVWAEDRGATWAVFVRDNGVGFDPRYRHKLFSMFQRLHHQDEFGGVGVSLANARRVITRHGGAVLAEGQPDGGATFGFVLPKSKVSAN
ncbi:GAF domain-containing protein [Deinococcus alpinitundrae]|uniref:GAF domain-containing protein n=1 Tax=Deinococcus alpinitundrae TaxID=468913 RepID=UPI00137AE069|nr:GAF domain-containing protein [Deinococcus alpinitundrae]